MIGYDNISSFQKTNTYLYLTQHWYQDYLQYRRVVKPNFGSNGNSVDWASDTYTAESSFSRKLDELEFEPESSTDGTRGVWSAESSTCMTPNVKSQYFDVENLSSDNPGSYQDQTTEAWKPIELPTPPEMLDPNWDKNRDYMNHLPEAIYFEHAARRTLEAEYRARMQVATEDIHVKGRCRGLPLLLEAHGELQK